jgi:hypothetical protein
MMSDIALAPEALPQPIPLRELLPWIVFAGLLALIAIYFVGAEQGATSLISGHWVHEFTHDGRHMLGFPCHLGHGALPGKVPRGFPVRQRDNKGSTKWLQSS